MLTKSGYREHDCGSTGWAIEVIFTNAIVVVVELILYKVMGFRLCILILLIDISEFLLVHKRSHRGAGASKKKLREVIASLVLDIDSKPSTNLFFYL